MAEAMPRREEERFYIGSVEDPDELVRGLGGVGELVDEAPLEEGQTGRLVLVKAPERFRDDLMRRLGPNAEVLAHPDEARAVWFRAKRQPAGEPYSPGPTER